MSRFLICSFALVLLYPAGIDMYLVGLPRIAAGLSQRSAVAYCVLRLSGGHGSAMLFAGKVADRSGRKPVAIPGAALFIIASGVLIHWLKPARYFLQGAFYRGWARAVVTWLRSPFYATHWMIDVGLKCCRYSTALPASFRC